MKSIVLIGVFILFCNFCGNSQEVNSEINAEQNSQDRSNQRQTVKKSDYTVHNLQQASTENLALYLKKAKRLKTAGLVTTIAGPTMLVTGILLIGVSWGNYGGGLTLVGLTTTAVGIPVLVTGSKRVYKVKYAIETHNTASLSVAPGFMFADQSKNLVPAVSLKYSF